MTLMSHFAEAENPQGIVEPMRRIEQAAEGWIARARAGQLGGDPLASGRRILTGFVQASCCMARRLRQWQDIASTGAEAGHDAAQRDYRRRNLRPGE